MEMSEALIQLADKLGIATTEIYQIMLSAQQIQGVMSLLTLVFSLMFGLLGVLIVWKIWKSEEDNSDIGDGIFASLAIGVLVFVVSLALSTMIEGAILKIIAPEYTALTEMISTLAAFR